MDKKNPPSAAARWFLLSPIEGSFQDKEKGALPQEWEAHPFESEQGMRAEASRISEALAMNGNERWLQFSFQAIEPALWSKIMPPCGKVVRFTRSRP